MLLEIDTVLLKSCGVNLHLTQTDCTLDDDEQIRYTTYGIRLTDQMGNELAVKKDISTNRVFVEQFINKCVEYELRTENFEDCLEDYLTEHV